MLPISVANELRHSRPVPAKRYDSVTLLFSGIVGFSDYCAANTDAASAMKIVQMLNQLYTAFDVLTDPKQNPNVYKVSTRLRSRVLRTVVGSFTWMVPCVQVETVGDKYMAVSGLPEPCTTHARCMARVALDMMDLGKEVLFDGQPVVRFHISLYEICTVQCHASENKSFLFTENYNWNSLRWSCNRSYRPPHA